MNLTKKIIIPVVFVIIFVGFAVLLLEHQGAPEMIRQTSVRSSIISIARADRQAKAIPGLPVHLTIQKINVSAAVGYVGLMPNGELGAPKGPDEVDWYELGPRPGELGTAVIDGHYGRWQNGQGSVFDNLDKLVKGDKIQIQDQLGVTTVFVVRDSQVYDPEADALKVFFSGDGKSHLNLITCEGVWDNSSKSFSKRLVIFTDIQ